MDTGVQTRKKKKKAKHGYATRGGADNEDTATNRLTTRALYDTDEEEVSTHRTMCIKGLFWPPYEAKI